MNMCKITTTNISGQLLLLSLHALHKLLLAGQLPQTMLPIQPSICESLKPIQALQDHRGGAHSRGKGAGVVEEEQVKAGSCSRQVSMKRGGRKEGCGASSD